MSRPLIEITGFAELQEKLRELSDDRKKKAEMVKLLRKVAQGTVKAARRRVQVSNKPHMVSGSRTKKTIQPGALKKSIGVITGKRSNKNPRVYVGPRAKGNFDGWYGNFVEAGHDIYNNPTAFRARGVAKQRNKLSRIRGRGANATSGRVSGQHYMRDTYQETKGQVTEETAQQVTVYIQKQIDRLSR